MSYTNPPILLPDANSFADLFVYVGEWQPTENHERHNPANGEPQMIGGNEIGPYATIDLGQIGGERHRSIAVQATDAVLETVAPRIVTDEDHLSFRLIAHHDGRCLVVMEHGYIIGSHWLGYIDPATIPDAPTDDGPTGFEVRLALDNAAMQKPGAIPALLRKIADNVETSDETYRKTLDPNGSSVGFYAFTEGDEPLGRWSGGGPIQTGDL